MLELRGNAGAESTREATSLGHQEDGVSEESSLAPSPRTTKPCLAGQHEEDAGTHWTKHSKVLLQPLTGLGILIPDLMWAVRMGWGHPSFSLLGGEFLQLAVRTYCSRTLYIVSISYRVYLVLFILVEVFSSGAQDAQGSSLGDSQSSGSIILSCFAPRCTGDVREWKHSAGDQIYKPGPATCKALHPVLSLWS